MRLIIFIGFRNEMLLSLHAKISWQSTRLLLHVKVAPIGDADLACNERAQAEARGGKD
jgi:hypothetical protein